MAGVKNNTAALCSFPRFHLQAVDNAMNATVSGDPTYSSTSTSKRTLLAADIYYIYKDDSVCSFASGFSTGAPLLTPVGVALYCASLLL